MTLGAMLVLALVATMVALVLWTWWSNRQAPPAADVPAADREGCTLAIGASGDELPTAQTVTLPPGTALEVVARCPAGVRVVDFVVTMPPPAGAQMVLPTTREGGAWIWRAETTEAGQGQTLTFYGYADGRPSGEPVTLTVEGVQTR